MSAARGLGGRVAAHHPVDDRLLHRLEQAAGRVDRHPVRQGSPERMLEDGTGAEKPVNLFGGHRLAGKTEQITSARENKPGSPPARWAMRYSQAIVSWGNPLFYPSPPAMKPQRIAATARHKSTPKPQSSLPIAVPLPDTTPRRAR